MQNYKDLKVWKTAHYFTLKVYETTKIFPKEEIYSLTNQLRRAAASIPSNIAEGCGKMSRSDFANFLNIALGSANEAEYYIILSKDLGYINMQIVDQLLNEINEIKAMLIVLTIKVRTSKT